MPIKRIKNIERIKEYSQSGKNRFFFLSEGEIKAMEIFYIEEKDKFLFVSPSGKQKMLTKRQLQNQRIPGTIGRAIRSGELFIEF
jgi:hypothetical protein